MTRVVERVLDKHAGELKSVLERDTSKLEAVKTPFPRMSYQEAIERLQKAGHPAKWGDDFGGDEETVLASQFDRPLIVHRYPAELKAFYFNRDAADPKVALGMDVLAPEGYGEIVGGGQREDDLAALEARIEEHKLPKEAFSWYLDLRRYGSVPLAGFGLGVERILIACDAEGVYPTEPTPLHAYVVDVTGGESAVLLTSELRRAGLRADRAFDGRSMKSQMKSADRSGALVALLVGPKELADGTVVLRPLRQDDEQRSVARADIVAEVRRAAAESTASSSPQ